MQYRISSVITLYFNLVTLQETFINNIVIITFIFRYICIYHDKELIVLLHSWPLLSMLSEKAHKYLPIIRRFLTFYVQPKWSTQYHPHLIFRANIDLWVCKLWNFVIQGYQVSSLYLAHIIALLNISKKIGMFYHPNNDWHVFNP